MIYVDFNALDAEGRLRTLTRHSDSPIIPGQSVLLTDGEDHVKAFVEAVDDKWAELRLDWETWNQIPLFVGASDRPQQSPLDALDSAQRAVADNKFLPETEFVVLT